MSIDSNRSGFFNGHTRTGATAAGETIHRSAILTKSVLKFLPVACPKVLAGVLTFVLNVVSTPTGTVGSC